MDEETRYTRVIGLLVRELRQRAGLSQTQLADRMGSTQPTVSRWERGLCCPSLWEMRMLGRALGVALPSLCEDADRIVRIIDKRPRRWHLV